MWRNYLRDGGGNGAVERVLGDGGATRLLGGARFSTTSVREGSGEGESERVSARGGAQLHR